METHFTYCPTNNSTQWVPRSFIEPVQEIVESMVYHVVRGTIVKPKARFKYHKNVNLQFKNGLKIHLIIIYLSKRRPAVSGISDSELKTWRILYKIIKKYF